MNNIIVIRKTNLRMRDQLKFGRMEGFNRNNGNQLKLDMS